MWLFLLNQNVSQKYIIMILWEQSYSNIYPTFKYHPVCCSSAKLSRLTNQYFSLCPKAEPKPLLRNQSLIVHPLHRTVTITDRCRLDDALDACAWLCNLRRMRSINLTNYISLLSREIHREFKIDQSRCFNV